MAASRILLVLLSISLLALTSAQRDNEDDESSLQEQEDLEAGDSNQQHGAIHAKLNEIKNNFQDQQSGHDKAAIKSKRGKNGQRGRRSSGGDSLEGQDRQSGNQTGRGGQGGRGRSGQKGQNGQKGKGGQNGQKGKGGQNGQRGKGGQKRQHGKSGQRNQQGQYNSSPNDQRKGETAKDGLQ